MMNIFSFVGGCFIFNKNEIVLFICSETNLEIGKNIIRKLSFSFQIFINLVFHFLQSF